MEFSIIPRDVNSQMPKTNEVFIMYLCVEEYANESVVRFSDDKKRVLQKLIAAEESQYGFDKVRKSWILCQRFCSKAASNTLLNAKLLYILRFHS